MFRFYDDELHNLILVANKSVSEIIAYLNEVLVKMRLGGKSNKNINNIVQKSWEDYQALKLNSIPFPLFTLFCKNVRKLSQFF